MESSNSDDLLSFKEFPPVHSNQGRGSSAQISINSPQRTGFGFGNDNDLRQGFAKDLTSGEAIESEMNPISTESSEDQEKKQNYSIWSIEYYQQFFNVDTIMVLDRIASSIVPKKAPPNYLKMHIGQNPDLYGPFWIIVTLVFSIAIAGNMANYLQYAGVDVPWRYNFHLVSYAATAIFIYACFVPSTLWAVLKWSPKQLNADVEAEEGVYIPGLLSLICIYGYSLAIYIPVSILWVIQISFLQWVLVITAAFLSGSVLILHLRPVLQQSKFSLILIIGILAIHFLLAAGFMLYFFHVPEPFTKVVDVVEKITKNSTKVSQLVTSS